MGIFNFFKSSSDKGQFVSEREFINNREKQLQMTPHTLKQLRDMDISEDMELKLEYFFYTNTREKAAKLAVEMESLNYSVQHGVAAGNSKQFVITGWTTGIKMTEAMLKQWTKEMCELGYKFDCDLDGWGTDPNQE